MILLRSFIPGTCGDTDLVMTKKMTQICSVFIHWLIIFSNEMD